MCCLLICRHCNWVANEVATRTYACALSHPRSISLSSSSAPPRTLNFVWSSGGRWWALAKPIAVRPAALPRISLPRYVWMPFDEIARTRQRNGGYDNLSLPSSVSGGWGLTCERAYPIRYTQVCHPFLHEVIQQKCATANTIVPAGMIEWGSGVNRGPWLRLLL